MIKVLHSEVAGPLEPYASGFAAWLGQRGYRAGTAVQQLGLVAHLSRWLATRGLGASDLTPAVVERYVAARRAIGHRNLHSGKALVPLLDYLRRLGALEEPAPPPARTPSELLLARYREYLLGERGMGSRSVRGYLDLVRPFIEQQAQTGETDLAGLTAGAVTSFLVAESRRLSPKTLQRQASAMRSLLRFWHISGLISRPLAQAVPKVASRSPGLARALPPEQVNALLASCDRDQPAGCRDFAMLALLARVGLRAGEVAGLQLDDLDWRSGELVVSGKGGRHDRLPMPADAGAAIAQYLQHGRPADALNRSVFIRTRAPHTGLSTGGVTQAVAAAAGRAGLPTMYAHRLRHSAATSVLAAGGSLSEIGQLLRHRGPLTTSIYAKADTEALRALARPWPAGGAS